MRATLARARLDPQADLRAIVEDLRVRVAALEARQLSTPDRVRLAELLPAIGGVSGSSLFTARDVTSATDAGLQAVTRGLTANALGRLLARAEGIAVGGFVATAAAHHRGTWFWTVEAVR